MSRFKDEQKKRDAQDKIKEKNGKLKYFMDHILIKRLEDYPEISAIITQDMQIANPTFRP